jgi:copper chaperone CopZ
MRKYIMAFLCLGLAMGAGAQFTRATLQASGLTCALCTKAINSSLERLPFVAAVKPDIASSSFLIEFKPKADIDIDALRNGVEDAGFTVAKLQLTANFNNLAIANDRHIEWNGMVFHFLKVPSQELSGEQVIRVVDKHFLPAAEFKKFSAVTKLDCVQTGKAGHCCSKDHLDAATRIYHVTI